MRTTGGLQSDEASSAAWEGGRGAVAGAAKVCNLSRREGRWTNWSVGCWSCNSRCCRVCNVTYLSRIDYSIQGVSFSEQSFPSMAKFF